MYQYTWSQDTKQIYCWGSTISERCHISDEMEAADVSGMLFSVYQHYDKNKLGVLDSGSCDRASLT